MQKRPWQTSDLLALRDDEPHSAGVRIDDPSVAEELDKIKQLQTQLQNLPDVSVDEHVWLDVLPARAPKSSWLRFPLATAASVFFASVVGIYLLFGEPLSDPSSAAGEAAFAGAIQVDEGGLQLATLMNQSRDLERRLQGADPWMRSHAGADAGATAEPRRASRTERRLLYRLADVDAQIARLYEAEVLDAPRRQTLWAQRVSLLESLVAVRGGTDPRLFEDSRSM